jgi:hypothetical protein
LFCPCCFYCLFLCNLCIIMFFDLWFSGLSLWLVASIFVYRCPIVNNYTFLFLRCGRILKYFHVMFQQYSVLSWLLSVYMCSLWLFVLVISSYAKFYVVTFCPICFVKLQNLNCSTCHKSLQFTLLVLYVLWRSCSILFICFVLVASIVSFYVISVSPCFFTYDFFFS